MSATTSTAGHVEHASAAEFDAAQRALSARLNVPVRRMGSIPMSAYSTTPVLVYSSPQAPGGIDYVVTSGTPIPHGIEGLIAEIMYSLQGSDVTDRTVTSSKSGTVTYDGTFTFWSKPASQDDGTPAPPPSKIAQREVARITANGGQTYRGQDPVIIDNSRTLARLIEVLRSSEDPLGRVAARLVALGTSLPHHPDVCVLTRAAALLNYVPASLKVGSLATWLAAFQIQSVSPVDDAAAVWRRLVSDNRVPDAAALKLFASFPKLADNIMRFGAISSGASAIRTDAQCSAAHATFAMIETLDPLLRDRSLASGDLVRTTIRRQAPLDEEEPLELLVTSQTFKFKVGDRVVARPETRHRRDIDATAARVGIEGDQIRVALRPQMRNRVKDGEVVSRSFRWSGPEMSALSIADNESSPILLTKTVMSPFATKIPNKRWMRGTERPQISRQMPVDVAIAAAKR